MQKNYIVHGPKPVKLFLLLTDFITVIASMIFSGILKHAQDARVSMTLIVLLKQGPKLVKGL